MTTIPTSIAPWLSVRNAAKEVDFYKTAFGAIETYRLEAPDARALAAGASEIFPVGEGHGWRLGRLADPFGLHWEIGHPLEA